MTSPSTRRLLKESTDLHKNPSPYFTAAPVNDTNLHDWHFTLVGPPSPTPYANGLYHGRITFPAAYPLRPPSFRFLTPSARFEVNREICLSISGHHEETWQPAWGVRTALLAIRSEIFSGESKGQVGGMEGSEELRREYAGLSRGWVCRECGGSNELRMREFWELCREVGVEVDVEGDWDGDGDGKGQEGEKDAQEGETEQQQQQQQQQQEHDSSAAPVVQHVPVSAPEPTPETEIPASTDPVISQPPVSEPSQPIQRSTSVSTPTRSTAPNSPPASTQLSRTRPQADPTSPANSPWLDRAIICVIVALVILVLRRTIDPDDL
jgi:ubiquitin-conjugating enzyme E2 J1